MCPAYIGSSERQTETAVRASASAPQRKPNGLVLFCARRKVRHMSPGTGGAGRVHQYCTALSSRSAVVACAWLARGRVVCGATRACACSICMRQPSIRSYTTLLPRSLTQRYRFCSCRFRSPRATIGTQAHRGRTHRRRGRLTPARKEQRVRPRGEGVAASRQPPAISL